MYTPVQFKVDEAAEAHALMRAHPFAILVTHGADGVVATHLPTMLKVDEANPLGRVECHVARPNPQWKTFSADADALMIFQGAEAYIRPGWYPSKAQHGKAVPTWNYVAICARGRLEVVTDRDALMAHVTELSDLREAAFPEPWQVTDAPAEYMEKQLRAIIGFRLTIEALEGKMKLSQNRSDADRTSVAGVLQASEDANAHEVGEMMQAANTN